MLKLMSNKKIDSFTKNYSNNINKIKTSKHFPSSTREWKNSIFLFNKNNLNLIPSTDLSAISIIKSYFTLFNRIVENRLRTKRLPKKYRKQSSNKIYISNGEFKHTNNKVIINLYLFNRQKNIYLRIIKRIRKRLKRLLKKNNKIFLLRWRDIERFTLYFFIKRNKVSLSKWLKNTSKNTRINNYVRIKIRNYCRKVIRNEKNRRLLYWYYKRINYINKSKRTYVYLQYLKEQLSKLYNKQVEFNLINLKRFYLNSDILSESITTKITNKRKKTLRYLKKLRDKVRIKRKISFLHRYMVKNKLEEKNITQSNNSLRKSIIRKLKYRNVTGFRVEARGRLTKRYTASRSVLRLKYKGNLLNIDSSIKGLSSVFLKGNLKSNVQYTKLVSKSRIGSFGIKGWISGN